MNTRTPPPDRRRTSIILFIASATLFLFPAAAAQSQTFSLNTANQAVVWKVKPQADVHADSANLIDVGYAAEGWVRASVPGTVFASYVDAGLEADPNYADNIYRVNKSLYDRNFWYRTEFILPPAADVGEKLWLNFLGVNRDAEIFFNGRFLGSVRGFVQRGKFDVTSIVHTGARNALAVLVSVPQAPISNGAAPTYGSSGGWDWMPAVPGLNMGIQDDVFLSAGGQVSIVDPWIRTDLTPSRSAMISVQTELRNHSGTEQKGILSGLIMPGNISFSMPVSVGAHDTKTVVIEGFS